MPRLVMPEYPHHVVQRGVRSMDVFRDAADRELYLDLLRAQAERWGLRFLGWCLMTNHVHLIAIPSKEESLARAIGEAHRLYTRARNFAEGVRGYLFQGRFHSCALDEQHTLTAVRYAELNPVRAGMAKRPEDYAWSSARYHLGKSRTDGLGASMAVVEAVGDWRGFLAEATGDEGEEIEKRLRTGRPGGGEAFIDRLETLTGRRLRPGVGGWPLGRPRKGGSN